MKPGNSGLVGQKNTKEIMINRRGTKMEKINTDYN